MSRASEIAADATVTVQGRHRMSWDSDAKVKLLTPCTYLLE